MKENNHDETARTADSLPHCLKDCLHLSLPSDQLPLLKSRIRSSGKMNAFDWLNEPKCS